MCIVSSDGLSICIYEDIMCPLTGKNAVASASVAKRISVASIETDHYVPTDGMKPHRKGDR